MASNLAVVEDMTAVTSTDSVQANSNLKAKTKAGMLKISSIQSWEDLEEIGVVWAREAVSEEETVEVVVAMMVLHSIFQTILLMWAAMNNMPTLIFSKTITEILTVLRIN